MEHRIDSSVCLVTGAARSLGREIARALARHGATIAVHYHQSRAAAQELCEELTRAGVGALPFQADVTKAEDIERMVAEVEERLGAVDILVNNVGPYVDTAFVELPLADFDRVMAGNVRATFLLSQRLGQAMKARGHGHIINIAATDGFHRSRSVYGLAKAGVMHLTEAMALELAPEVSVNAVAPDLIADNEDLSPGLARAAVGATPLGRLVRRDEVAHIVYLLCTAAFHSVTGQTLVMDGGRSVPRIAEG